MKKHETISEIAADLRDSANKLTTDNLSKPRWSNFEVGEIYGSIANRIDEAYKREFDKDRNGTTLTLLVAMTAYAQYTAEIFIGRKCSAIEKERIDNCAKGFLDACAEEVKERLSNDNPRD